MAKNLYEMDSKYWQLYELLDELEDEDQIDALIERCDTLEDAIEHKIGNLIKWCRELATEAEAAKREQDRYAAIGKAAANKLLRIKGLIRLIMERHGKQKMVTPAGRAGIQNTAAKVVVYNIEQALASGYIKNITPDETWLDKTAIKQALQNGEDVPGVLLQQGQTLVIR